MSDLRNSLFWIVIGVINLRGLKMLLMVESIFCLVVGFNLGDG